MNDWETATPSLGRFHWDRQSRSPLGHAHPAFKMHTYQHLLPGMSASAAEQFANLVATAGR